MKESETGIAAGSLMLMPHRLAIALQADGWIVRNDLVWWKRNPMPESVAGWRWENDKLRKSSWRHTRAHEYVFQLVKGMGYFCNQEVVREESNDPRVGSTQPEYNDKITDDDGGMNHATRKGLMRSREYSSGRNPRSVMDVPTAPYKGAHYATFPPKLIAPLIRASVPRRCCPECGMAWAPVVDLALGEVVPSLSHDESINPNKGGATYQKKLGRTVTAYRPTCECGVTQHEPGIVLDIFGGSGTTGMVAKQLMRKWVVMDISRPYLDEQAKVRTGSGTPANALDGLPMFGGEDEDTTN